MIPDWKTGVYVVLVVVMTFIAACSGNASSFAKASADDTGYLTLDAGEVGPSTSLRMKWRSPRHHLHIADVPGGMYVITVNVMRPPSPRIRRMKWRLTWVSDEYGEFGISTADRVRALKVAAERHQRSKGRWQRTEKDGNHG
jgi:hypothetical protein